MNIYVIFVIAVLVVLAVAVAVCLCVFAVRRKLQKAKGNYGEMAVIKTIKNTNQGKYYLINDIILLDKNGMSHQIDHIVINRNGIFVIETKNHSGLIYGEENLKEWRQVLAYGNKVNRFPNPIKQNMSHIYCLKQILPEVCFTSLVVFVQDNVQNVVADGVIGLKDLPYELTKERNRFLSDELMLNYYRRIIMAKSDVTERQHVKKIKNRQKAIAAGICPICGSKLVVRNRKDGTGSFYGCSSYPKCKFTKNID